MQRIGGQRGDLLFTVATRGQVELVRLLRELRDARDRRGRCGLDFDLLCQRTIELFQ